MKVYVAYCEGFMSSDWICFAGNDLESMKDKIVNDFEYSVDEIKVYENNEELYNESIKVHYEGNGGTSFDGIIHEVKNK